MDDSCGLLLFAIIFTQAKSTRDPMDLEAMFEQKLTELQRGNTSDSLKEHEKYVELQEHIHSAIQSANGKYITVVHPHSVNTQKLACVELAMYVDCV